MDTQQAPQLRRRVLACVDNRVGFELLSFLHGLSNVEIVGVIVQPENTALFFKQIVDLCRNEGVPVFDINHARAEFEIISALRPDFLVSAYFDYILDSRFLDLPTIDAINVHPGYLPYNRGFYYYVWAELDGTPAGVSIHKMRPGADTGELISQSRVFVNAADTGETIYKKHEDEAIRLFTATWPAIVAGKHKYYPQLHSGTRHRLGETTDLACVDPFQPMRVIDLINRVRLLTGPDGSRCTVSLDEKTYRLSVTLDELVQSDVATERRSGMP